MFWQWVLRLLGYGLTAGAAVVTQKYGVETGAAVGAAGGFVLNKATQYLIPRRTEAPR